MILTARFIFISFLFISHSAFATGNLPAFFKNTEIQNFRLRAPFQSISEAQKNNPNILELKKLKFSGEISYQIQGNTITLPVKLSIKGYTTAMFCALPKLEIKFSDHAQTIFAGLKKIDLHTHCDDSDQPKPDDYFVPSMANNHREVTAYRILEVLGLKAFATRAAYFSYIDSETNLAPVTAPKTQYQAFFLEDKSEYIKRNAVTEIKGANDTFKEFDIADGKTKEEQYKFLSAAENAGRINLLELVKIEIFQALIGNHDWHIKANASDLRDPKSRDKHELWNTKLFEDPLTKKWSFLAQDFNFSMITMIDHFPEGIAGASITAKFIPLISREEKDHLINSLIQDRSKILGQLDFLKADPASEKLKSFLNQRIEIVITELKK